jgi:SAM-dependent methyltransferase
MLPSRLDIIAASGTAYRGMLETYPLVLGQEKSGRYYTLHLEGFMTEREQIYHKAQSFFDDLWMRGDPWELETSNWEQERYARLLAMLDQPRYGRVLEIGCGAGTFTRRLAGLADKVLALDVSSEAIAKARAAQSDLKQVEFRIGNIMDYNLREEEPWDLIVMSETVYFLGWLYSFFDVSWLAAEMFEATRSGGQMLLANTQFETGEPLLRPCIIRTYRDLFLNVGYELNAEKIVPGEKHGVSFEVLMSLFRKVDPTTGATS